MTNPFDEVENNAESLVSLKLDRLNKTSTLQSKVFDDRRSIMSIKVLNSKSEPELNFRFAGRKGGTINLGDSRPPNS